MVSALLVALGSVGTVEDIPLIAALLEDAEERGLLEIEKNARSGGYLVLGFGPEATD